MNFYFKILKQKQRFSFELWTRKELQQFLRKCLDLRRIKQLLQQSSPQQKSSKDGILIQKGIPDQVAKEMPFPESLKHATQNLHQWTSAPLLQYSLSICSNCDAVLFPNILFKCLCQSIVSMHITFMTFIHNSIIHCIFCISQKCLLPNHWYKSYLLMWVQVCPQ